MLKQLAVAGIIAAGLLRSPAAAQPQFDSIQRERARQMLRDLHDALQHHYYDPQYQVVGLFELASLDGPSDSCHACRYAKADRHS
jgi:hypothetical protein